MRMPAGASASIRNRARSGSRTSTASGRNPVSFGSVAMPTSVASTRSKPASSGATGLLMWTFCDLSLAHMTAAGRNASRPGSSIHAGIFTTPPCHTSPARRGSAAN